MYQDFYGLHERPFGLPTDPRFFYRSASHGNALDVVSHGLASRAGAIVLTGISGTGKTTLCRALLETSDRQSFTSLLLNPCMPGETMLRVILDDLGAITRAEVQRGRLAHVSSLQLLRVLNDYLLFVRTVSGPALIIVDEAHKLAGDALELVGRLAGLSVGREPLVQVVLAGQLSLSETLRGPAAHALATRVAVRYRLRSLTLAETVAYVRHRLAVASGPSSDAESLFTRSALQLVHRVSAGNPRLINTLCDGALVRAFSNHAPAVDVDAVAGAVTELGLEPRSLAAEAASAFVRWMRRAAAL